MDNDALTPYSFYHTPWEPSFLSYVRNASHTIQISCPFIKLRNIRLILAAVPRVVDRPIRIEVLTRLNLPDCRSRVHDLAALSLLLDNPLSDRCSIDVRIDNRLHAKLYMFDGSTAIITSSNLTYAGFYRNKEVAIAVRDDCAVHAARQYFRDLFDAARPLSNQKLEDVSCQLSDSPLPANWATEDVLEVEEVSAGTETSIDADEIDIEAVEAIDDSIANNVESELRRGFATITVDEAEDSNADFTENQFCEILESKLRSAFGEPTPSRDDLMTIFAHASIHPSLRTARPSVERAERWHSLGLGAFLTIVPQLVIRDTASDVVADVIQAKARFIVSSGHLV